MCWQSHMSSVFTHNAAIVQFLLLGCFHLARHQLLAINAVHSGSSTITLQHLVRTSWVRVWRPFHQKVTQVACRSCSWQRRHIYKHWICVCIPCTQDQHSAISAFLSDANGVSLMRRAETHLVAAFACCKASMPQTKRGYMKSSCNCFTFFSDRGV